MNILIVYGTTEGQTRRICRFCADHLIAQGHSVELMQASGEEAEMDLSRFDAAIVAASVHLRVYQIAARKGQHVDPHADTEYTDWAALRDVLNGWMARTDAAS